MQAAYLSAQHNSIENKRLYRSPYMRYDDSAYFCWECSFGSGFTPSTCSWVCILCCSWFQHITVQRCCYWSIIYRPHCNHALHIPNQPPDLPPTSWSTQPLRPPQIQTSQNHILHTSPGWMPRWRDVEKDGEKTIGCNSTWRCGNLISKHQSKSERDGEWCSLKSSSAPTSLYTNT